MSDASRPHPQNAPGPFYVEDGCCLACGVPAQLAPGMFAYDDRNHCFVLRQPANDAEVDQAIRAAFHSETGCIRYRGTMGQVLRRMVEAGLGQCCDSAIPQDVAPVVRNVARFKVQTPLPMEKGSIAISPRAIAVQLRSYFVSKNRGRGRYRNRFTPIVSNGRLATLSVSWYENIFHRIEVRGPIEPDDFYLLRHGRADYSLRGLSLTLHDWLISNQCFGQIGWYSEQEWAEKRPPHASPF